MPEYVYKDTNGHVVTTYHPMSFEGVVTCTECLEAMWRVPQAVGVVWGGLPPHEEHHIGPAARWVIDNVEQNKEKLQAKKEARGE